MFSKYLWGALLHSISTWLGCVEEACSGAKSRDVFRYGSVVVAEETEAVRVWTRALKECAHR